MYKIGDQFYDEKNNRYLTITAVHVPKVYYCTIEEMNDNYEYEITDSGLFYEYELGHMTKEK